MEYTKGFRYNRKRANVEVLNLRDKMANNHHYNIFSGDQRYKTDFWLRFLYENTQNKFEKKIHRRTKTI